MKTQFRDCRCFFLCIAHLLLTAGMPAPLLADVRMNPDDNTLWIENFDPFKEDANSRDGWFAFEPEEIAVEPVDGGVRLREVSEYAGGSIQRIFPVKGSRYPYLQVRVRAVENSNHFFKAWLRLPGHGHPHLGRMPTGICTVDLSSFPFLADLTEIPLDLAVIGPTGKTPSGFVELDWVRLVRSPMDGLTVELVDQGETNQVAEIGDTIVFTYRATGTVSEPVAVTCSVAESGEVFRFCDRDEVPLYDDGLDGDAVAQDGVFTGRLAVTPEATEFSGGKGSIIATTMIDGEARNASPPFAVNILPAGWRAARAAQTIALGDLVLREDFSESPAANWRAYDDGWSVHRPEQSPDGDRAPHVNGLRALTYDRPHPNGRWIALPERALEDSCLSAAVRPLGGSGSMMLALRFQDPENHVCVRVEGGDAVYIERVRAGWREILARTKLRQRITRKDGQPASRLTFTAAGATLVAHLDGQPVLHAYDNTFADGRAALGLNRQNGQFEDIVLRSATVTAPPENVLSAGVRLRIALREPDRSFGRDAGSVRIPLVIEHRASRQLPPTTVETTLLWESLYWFPVAHTEIPALASESTTRLVLRLDARHYQAGSYWLIARLRDGKGNVIATDAERLLIGSPVPTERMDVFWWGGANTAARIEAAAGAGVTVMHEFSRRSPELWRLGCRLGLTYYSYPPSVAAAPADIKKTFENPKAGPHAVRVDELDPAFRAWALQTARSHARAWRANRRLRYMLLNTEIETRVYPSLSDAAEARYEERLGFPRPDEADVPYVGFSPALSLEHFPDRIVPDDAPLYLWFRFFYTDGGGALSEITSAQARAIAEIAPEVTTFHDPVLRGPQFYGRWEDLGLLNHWTYVEQNPLDTAAFADELVCLAEHGNWEQKISQMIQAFAYSDRAMPTGQEDAPPYLREAPFVALPPDILSESVWLALSRPIDMIAFHGLQAMLETQRKESYRYTNPAGLTALGRVSDALIEPYGPVLRKIKARRGPRVALLLSAANTIFGRIPEGGGTRSLHNPLTAARIPIDVLYDDDVREGALRDYSVLAIPQCRFLLESVHRRIVEFQRDGGTVLLDEDAALTFPGALTLPSPAKRPSPDAKLELVPGEVLDIPDSPRAQLDAELRLTASALREQLLPRLGRKLFVDSPHPYLVLDARTSGDLTYVFAINDRRTIGPYLGPYGGVLERGVPISATIHFRESPGALYDALGRQRLVPSPAKQDRGSTALVDIPGGWGKLLVVCAEPLGKPAVSAAAHIDDGNAEVTLEVRTQYASKRTVTGIVPLRIDIRSTDGALNDYSRFTATAENGIWTTTIPVAENEPAGIWTIEVTELIGGHKQGVHVQVPDVNASDRTLLQRPALTTKLALTFDGEPGAQNEGSRTGPMTLRGTSRLMPGGRQSGCLESFRSVEDQPQGADMGPRPEWSPQGAFSMDLWLRPKAEMLEAPFSFLVDCNYYLSTRDDPNANAGYAFFLKPSPDGNLRPTVVLGFGTRSETFTAKPIRLDADTWYRLGFAYDGSGRVTIHLNGRGIGGGATADGGPIAPARVPLIVGGRVGSSHYGCAAFIDNVTLTRRMVPAVE